jgi:hypothetical protein
MVASVPAAANHPCAASPIGLAEVSVNILLTLVLVASAEASVLVWLFY